MRTLTTRRCTPCSPTPRSSRGSPSRALAETAVLCDVGREPRAVQTRLMKTECRLRQALSRTPGGCAAMLWCPPGGSHGAEGHRQRGPDTSAASLPSPVATSVRRTLRVAVGGPASRLALRGRPFSETRVLSSQASLGEASARPLRRGTELWVLAGRSGAGAEGLALQEEDGASGQPVLPTTTARVPLPRGMCLSVSRKPHCKAQAWLRSQPLPLCSPGRQTACGPGRERLSGARRAPCLGLRGLSGLAPFLSVLLRLLLFLPLSYTPAPPAQLSSTSPKC